MNQFKTLQLCRQVQQALNLALAGDIYIDQVMPAPDAGRLLVCISIPPDGDIGAALAELRRQTPALRNEVASAIHRKRAPELLFAPAGFEEGADE